MCSLSGRAEQGHPEGAGLYLVYLCPNPRSPPPYHQGRGRGGLFPGLDPRVLLPHPTRGQGNSGQHTACGVFFFLMALALAGSGPDLEVKGREEGESTMAHLAEHRNMYIFLLRAK